MYDQRVMGELVEVGDRRYEAGRGSGNRDDLSVPDRFVGGEEWISIVS